MADIIDLNLRSIKKGKLNLTDEQQCEVVYDKLLDLSEELNKQNITVPNAVQSMAHFLCDLTYDTAPSNAVATSILLGVINHKLGHIIEDEYEEIKDD